jgi:hypothetical protein
MNFLSTISSLNLFQIIPHFSIIYYKHCYQCFWMMYNIKKIFNPKKWNQSNGYGCLWLLLMSLHPKDTSLIIVHFHTSKYIRDRKVHSKLGYTKRLFHCRNFLISTLIVCFDLYNLKVMSFYYFITLECTNINMGKQKNIILMTKTH